VGAVVYLSFSSIINKKHCMVLDSKTGYLPRLKPPRNGYPLDQTVDFFISCDTDEGPVTAYNFCMATMSVD